MFSLPLPSRSINLKRNDWLCRPGTLDQHIYLVKEGVLTICIEQEPTDQIIRFAYENNVIVCLDSFFGNRPTLFYIQAIKKTKVYAVSKRDLELFMQEHPHYQSQWKTILESLIVQQMEREIDLLTDTPRERYQRVMSRSPQLFQKIPNKYIANYLRMSPETLSRIKKY